MASWGASFSQANKAAKAGLSLEVTIVCSVSDPQVSIFVASVESRFCRFGSYCFSTSFLYCVATCKMLAGKSSVHNQVYLIGKMLISSHTLQYRHAIDTCYTRKWYLRISCFYIIAHLLSGSSDVSNFIVLVSIDSLVYRY